MKMLTLVFVLLNFSHLINAGLYPDVSGSGGHRVRLADIQVLTLYENKMAAGRRSSPVPQLKCIGGSAKGKFQPKVVQCYNRGSDGEDIQWECKTDMSNAYRFGNIAVSCEGYDYPDDPYILSGSCGLEYTLDYVDSQSGRSSEYSPNYDGYGVKKSHSFGFTDIAFFVIVAIFIYVVYQTCVSGAAGRHGGGAADDRRPPGGGGGGGWGNPPPYPPGGSPPPPYGWNPDDSKTSGTGAGYAPPRGPAAGVGQPGFWTGLGAGGLLGYLFGNANRPGYQQRPGWGNGGAWGGGGGAWGGGGGGWGGGGGAGSSSGASGSRTASGFGGTRRR